VLLFIINMGLSLANGALLWVLYIALEPFVRRRWPEILVSWTRLLSGEWRDPVVGRDVLVGCATGVALACERRLAQLSPSWFGHPEELWTTTFVPLTGTRTFISELASTFGQAMAGALFFLFLLFLLRTVLRNQWIAGAGWVIILASPIIAGAEVPWIATPFVLIWLVLALFLLMRFGLVASTFVAFAYGVFDRFPMTLQISAWYSGMGIAAFAVLLAFSLYGFRTSLGNRPLLDTASVED
jgi:serine/threonine-protein kinase